MYMVSVPKSGHKLCLQSLATVHYGTTVDYVKNLILKRGIGIDSEKSRETSSWLKIVDIKCHGVAISGFLSNFKAN